MGNTTFTKAQANQIKALLTEIRKSDRDSQKRLRGHLRGKHKFKISDFLKSNKGFTPADFDSNVTNGNIKLV